MGRFRNPDTDEMPCDERYWVPTVNCCLKELHLRSGKVPVLSSTLWQSNIQIKHFSFQENEPFFFGV